MRRFTRTVLIAAALAAPVAVLPTLASAQSGCAARAHDRRVAGTIIGGIGGALVGNAIREGGTGAVIGGLGGAVIGNRLAGTNCYSRPAYRGASYPSTSYRRSPSYGYAARPAAPRAVRYVYYDRYGAPVSSGPAPQPYAPPYAPDYPGAVQRDRTPVSYGPSSAYCRTESQAFYDERGALIYRPVQMCSR